jgi:hypothetical protein
MPMRSKELWVAMIPSHTPLAILAVKSLRRARVKSSLLVAAYNHQRADPQTCENWARIRGKYPRPLAPIFCKFHNVWICMVFLASQ